MSGFIALLVVLGILMLFGAALAWLAGSASDQQVDAGKDALAIDKDDASAQGEEQVSTLSDAPLIEAVNAKLPQTQCAQCGYPGCRPYATAIIQEHVAINQCPPGGNALIADLANYLGQEAIPLDSERGETKPPIVAKVVEADCIGCTLCILACPVDAIVGASRQMHTIIQADCTGCELCLPPCPVDCIELIPAAVPLKHWPWPKPA